MLAVATLASCNKQDVGTPEAQEYNIGVQFDFSKLTTRAVDASAADQSLAASIRANLTSATLIAYNATGGIISAIEADSDAITAIKDNGSAMFCNIAAEPAKIKIILNPLSAAQEANVNSLQDETYVKTKMVYEGEADGPFTDGGVHAVDGNKIFTTTVTVKPAMSRFEVGLTSDAKLTFKNVPLPDPATGATKALLRKALGDNSAADARITAAELAAYDKWKAADPSVNTAPLDPSKFTYSFTWAYMYGQSSTKLTADVEAVYMNNFYFDRLNSNRATYTNNGTADWATAVDTKYGSGGESANMWDAITAPGAAGKYAGYNLFPVSGISNIPHVIIKLKMADGSSTRWFTFTQFETKVPEDLEALEAGKAYQLKADDVMNGMFDLPYKLTWDISYDGVSGGGGTDPIDPTDPKPEDNDKVDFKVAVTISEWVGVGIVPKI